MSQEGGKMEGWLNIVPPHQRHCILIPGTWECDLIWKIFADGIKDLEMGRLSWIIWGSPNWSHKCPLKTEAERNWTNRGEEGHVKMEAETGVMWPQAKGRLGPPEAGRVRKDPALQASEGVEPC